MNSGQKKKLIEKITIWSVAANCLLALIKFLIGFWGKSQAVVADGVHSLSAISSDIAILFGVKYWLKPPDHKHPYGHKKIESLVTVIIGLLLLIASISIAYNSIITFYERPIQKLSWFVIAAPLFSIVTKEILYRRTYKIGEKTSSSSVKANAWHHRSDAFSSLTVLAAVFVSALSNKLYFLDNIGAIIVSLFILKIAIQFIINSLSELTDTGVSQNEINKMKDIIKKIEGTSNAHDIRTRKIGESVFVDLHLTVDGNFSVYKGHEISEEVRNALIKKIQSVIDVVVHIEPKQELDKGDGYEENG